MVANSSDSPLQVQARIAALEQENERLRKSEARYRQVVENSPISILFINTEGYLTEINAAAEDLFGLPINELNQQASPIFDNPQLVENGTLPYMLRAFAGEAVIEAPTTYDASRDAAGGKLNYGRGHYAPIRDAGGSVEEIVEISADFNDFFALQAQLLEEKDRAAQDRAQLLGTIAQVANLLLRSPDYTTVLPEVVRLLGEAVGSDRCTIVQDTVHATLRVPAARVIGEWCKAGVISGFEATPELEATIPWRDLPELYEKLLQADTANYLISDLSEPNYSLFATQGITSVVYLPIVVNGKGWGQIGFDNCGEPRLFDEAEVAILKIAADSLAAAIERQAKDDELRRSEALYRSLFEISNEGIYRFELDPPISTSLPIEEQLRLAYTRYKLVQVNQTFVEIYGLTSSDGILGRGLVNIYPKDSKQNLEFNHDFIKNGYRIRSRESEGITFNGDQRYFLNGVIGFIENDCVTGGWGTQIDITEQRQAQQALLQAEHDRAELLSTVAQVANLLLRSPDYTAVLPDVVRLLGEAVGSDRCGVTQEVIDPTTQKVAIKFVAEHALIAIPSHLNAPEYQTVGVIDEEPPFGLRRRILQGESVNFLVAELSDSLWKDIFEAQQCTSLLIVPIMVQGQCWGQIGFDNCGEPRLFDEAEVAILKIAADSLAAAIERQAKDEELRRSEALYRSLFEISNEGIYRWQLDQPVSIDLPIDEQVELVYRHHFFAQGNDALAEMYGFAKAEDIVGMRLAEVHQQDSAITLEMMRTICGNRWQIRNAESEEIDANGQKRYYLNSIISFVENGFVSSGWGTQIDITELRQAQQALLQAEHDRAELLKTVTTVANQLLRSTDYTTVLPTVLQVLGEAASADRCGLLQNITDPHTGKPAVRMHTEWCRAGIQSSISHTPDLDSSLLWEVFPDGYATLSQGETLCVLVDDLTEPARSLLLAQGNISMLFVPIVVQGQFWGVFGFDYCQTEKTHDEATQTIFAIAVDSIAAAIERQHQQEALLQAEEAKQAAIAREREKAAHERAAELAKANEALKRSLTMLAYEPSLDKFLGYVLQTIADQLGDRSGAVYLYSESHHTTLLHLNYENGHLQQGDRITHPAATLPRPPKDWDDQYLPLLQHNQLLVHHASEFDSPAYAPYRQHNRDRGIQTLLIVPMLFGDKLLGSLTLRSTQHRDYSPEELEIARALAQQATLAIQLTQLAEQRRQTAVLEERNRMARDIHDSLAQSFTGIIMQLEAAKSLPNFNCPDLHTSLDCIGELARLGLSEARRSVRALRLAALETADFSTALQRLLHQTTNGTSIRASLAIEGTPKPLSPHLEENLLRIAQEALTNAIRHGHAHTITLQLLFEPTTVHLQITDDGSGFDPHSTSFCGFGLLGMQERTDQLNGQFHLVSQPGQGTAITVSVPI